MEAPVASEGPQRDATRRKRRGPISPQGVRIPLPSAKQNDPHFVEVIAFCGE